MAGGVRDMERRRDYEEREERWTEDRTQRTPVSQESGEKRDTGLFF